MSSSGKAASGEGPPKEGEAVGAGHPASQQWSGATKRDRWRRVRSGGLFIIGLAALSGFILSDVPARWLCREDPSAPVDAAVVLAGDPGYERTAAGAELVRSGAARLLILTGGEIGPGDSSESLRSKALEWGVPPERILLERVSHSTRESLLALTPILRQEGVTSVALVTSPYHQRRAFLLARRAWPGVRILSHSPKPSFWSPRNWWQKAASRRIVLTEYAKLFYSALNGWL